ncbi:MAG TPA: DUF5659 domain-containing protein [Bacteroidota bacterium]|nr:DUF5659 domain-containing protein [Bacteroidota bacterium]
MKQPYQTKDFPLAAFLVSSGLALQAHDRSHGVSTFTFPDSSRLHELVDDYYGFRALVNPVLYANAFRNLKSVMYSKTTENDNMHNHTRATK